MKPREYHMYSQADIAAIRKIRELSAIPLNDAARRLRVLKDCAALSSGTLATLTGVRNYEELETIQGEFVIFVKFRSPRHEYETWVDAWRDYQEAVNTSLARFLGTESSS